MVTTKRNPAGRLAGWFVAIVATCGVVNSLAGARATTAPASAPSTATSDEERAAILREKAEIVRVIEERIYVAKIALRRKEATGGEIRALNKNLAVARAATVDRLSPLLADRNAKNKERLEKYRPRFHSLEAASRTVADDLRRNGFVERALPLDGEIASVKDDGGKLVCRVPYRFRFVSKGGEVRQHDGYIAFRSTADDLMDPVEADIDGVRVWPLIDYDLRPWVVDVREGTLGVFSK